MQRRQFVSSAGARLALATCALAAAPRAWSAAQVVRFGQSASLSGGQAGYGRDVRDGIQAAFAAANRQSASTGVQFELSTLDDRGVRSACMQNALSLAESGAVALLGLTSGAGAEACLPVVEDSRMPMLGTASGNMGIRSANVPGLFHVRAGYDAEYARMVSYVKDFGLKRVGVVYLGDTSKANLTAMNQALGAMSVEPRVTLAIDRNAASFAAQADELLAAQLDCVLFTTNAAPAARIIGRMLQARYPGLFYASSFAGQDLLDALTQQHQSCVMSLVVPRPNAGAVRIVQQCQRDLALVPGARMGITTLEGYITGRIAVEATQQAARGGAVTRPRLRDALAGLRIDLGGYRVDFAGSMHGSRYVDLIAVDRYGRLVG